MKTTKTLWIIIIVLIVLNVGALAALWLTRSPETIESARSDSRRQRFFLERRLGFGENQTREYRRLRQQHFEQARPVLQEIRRQKELLYATMDGDTAIDRSQVLQRIGQLHAELESLTFEHFRNVRAIADEDQRRRMDSVMQNVIDRSAPGFQRRMERRGPGSRRGEGTRRPGN